MRVSIVTVSYNSADTIEDAIKSVQTQSYSSIEHIFIDGASTDGTGEIIQRNRDKKSLYLSEKDTGIYNAMNKGIRAATGDIIGILNSDDFYRHNDVISNVVKKFIETGAQACYGDCVYVDKNVPDRIIRYWKSKSITSTMFYNGEFPPHPTLFIKRSVYEKLGLFREDLKLSADFELMFRYLICNSIHAEYIHDVLITMRMGGASNQSIGRIVDSMSQCVKAFEMNGKRVCPAWFYFKTLIFRLLQTKYNRAVPDKLP